MAVIVRGVQEGLSWGHFTLAATTAAIFALGADSPPVLGEVREQWRLFTRKRAYVRARAVRRALWGRPGHLMDAAVIELYAILFLALLMPTRQGLLIGMVSTLLLVWLASLTWFWGWVENRLLQLIAVTCWVAAASSGLSMLALLAWTLVVHPEDFGLATLMARWPIVLTPILIAQATIATLCPSRLRPAWRGLIVNSASLMSRELVKEERAAFDRALAHARPVARDARRQMTRV